MPVRCPFWRLRRSLSHAAFALAALALSAAITPASAQADFPAKRITVIVPYPAGGIVDNVTRIMTDKIAEMWKATIIVEAKPGANSNLGNDLVARAEPDGYTWTFMGPR